MQFLDKRGQPLDGVIELEVNEEEVVGRLMARGRGDDKPDVIRERMATYQRQTKPLSDYYRQAKTACSDQCDGHGGRSVFSPERCG